MRTKAIPLSAGMAAKNFLKASSPPAEATIPATGSSSRPRSLSEASSSAGVGGNSPGSGALIGRFGCGGGLALSEAVARFFPRFFAAIAGPPSSLDLSRRSL